VRNAIVAALVAAFAATLLAQGGAKTFGPLSIAPLPSIADWPRPGRYVERRLSITNRSADAHRLRIVIGDNGERDRRKTVRELTVPANANVRVVIEQYVVDVAQTAAAISVDGRSFDHRVQLFQSGDSGYAENLLLVGRSLNDVTLREEIAKLPDEPYVATIHPAVASAEWSTNWLPYGAFCGVVLTRKDWAELPADVQTAILRWVRVGGVLTFMPSPSAPIDTKPGKLQDTFIGFGHVFESTVPFERLGSSRLKLLRAWRGSQVTFRDEYGYASRLPPAVEQRPVPTRSLLALLIVFAIALGPVTLIVLAKKERRIWIFWIVPIAGVLCAVAVVATTLMSEGVQRAVRTSSITILDQRTGDAATLAATTMYATFAPNGEVRFDGDTEVRPLGNAEGGEVNVSDGQRFTGLVDSRVSTFLFLRRSEPRRERLLVRKTASGLVAVNGLGSAIDELLVETADGTIHRARHIPAGAQQALEQLPERSVAAAPESIAAIVTSPLTWPDAVQHYREQPRDLLRPGTFVATLQSSPFVEQPLEHARTIARPGVVVGLLAVNGGDDAH
jgi:hypothetical protein